MLSTASKCFVKTKLVQLLHKMAKAREVTAKKGNTRLFL